MGQLHRCECGGGRHVRAGKGCAECEQIDKARQVKEGVDVGHKAYELPGVRLCDVLDPSREDLSPVEVALYRED